MEFRILGPLEVVEDGRPVRVERRLTRALLAYLLLHANEPVSPERIVDELWGPEPPRTATASLQNYVSRLRKTLGAERLRLEPGGYVLRVDPELFDLARFDRLVSEGMVSSGRQRAELLRAALALWRGPPLEDLVLEDFAQAEIGRLGERRLAAVEERVEAELELGLHGELVAELERLVAANPLRVRLRRQLMLALYRAGREQEALDAYQEARRMLRDDIGLEPSEELRSLEQAILRQDPALRAAPAADVERVAGSRRTITILFCDVVDSTELASALDAEAYARRISSYFGAVCAAIEAHGGMVEKFVGGAVMALFGVPELHEDDAWRAVRAAVEAREAVARLVEPLPVRIAVNTGEVVVAEPGTGPIVIGAAVNRASNLLERAGPCEIVLGDETRRLVRGAVRVEELQPDAWVLRGLTGEAAGVARRHDVPFIGREQELRRLLAAFRRVCRERTSNVVTVVGEAGLGKSRILRELVASVGDEGRVLVGRCVPYGAGATYLPLADIVRQAVPEASAAGIGSVLAGADDAEEVARRVAELVGLAEGPAAIGEAFWAVRRLLEAVSRDRPLVVVFDDLHWAEPTLLDLVEYLGGWTDAPILVLCAARRELLEARAGWGGPGSSGFVLELDPLPDDAIGAFVERLAGGPVDEQVGRQIVERAGGNPLFAEQLLALAAEAPDVALDRAPPTVEALIASRLDRLEKSQLHLLRRASVLGRRFVRAEAEDLGPVADADLHALGRKGLIHAVDGGFAFHHVLVRDVAYHGLTKAQRADLHERAAEAGARRDRPDELVGYHLEQAFVYSTEIAQVDEHARELAQAAADHLGRAGIRAWKRADAPATENLLGRATALLPETDPSRAPLMCELGVAVWAGGDPARADGVLSEAVAAASGRGDRGAELRALLEQANLRLFHGEDGAADELLEVATEAIPVFEDFGDDRSLGRAWVLVSYVQGGLRCQYGPSLEAAERARECSLRSGWPRVTQQVAAALFYGPTPTSHAIDRCESILDGAGLLGNAQVFAYLGGLRTMKGRLEEGRQLAIRADETCAELGLAVLRSTTLAPIRAETEMLAGDPASAERILRESCEAFERTGERVHLASQAAQLADALYAQGGYEDAERWTRVAEERASASDVSAQLSWRAVRAKALAQAGRPIEAEQIGREAVELAKGTDALNHRARVLLDLAEVLRLDRRAEEASGHVEAAIRLLERKENDVGAQRARALLAELAVA
jgi:DNA-binding SARP family transcriptional activator